MIEKAIYVRKSWGMARPFTGKMVAWDGNTANSSAIAMAAQSVPLVIAKVPRVMPATVDLASPF